MSHIEPKLIILRGNSGSGKTTTAKMLREKSTRKVALVEQDLIRRSIFKEGEAADADNNALISIIVEFSLARGYDVVLEGILRFERYGPMLEGLIKKNPNHFIYYFDISFEETLRRHSAKPNAHEFGEKEMATWYRKKNVTGFSGEKLIPESFSLEETVRMIMVDTNW